MSLFKTLKNDIPKGSTVVFKENGKTIMQMINYNSNKTTLYDDKEGIIKKKKTKLFEVAIS